MYGHPLNRMTQESQSSNALTGEFGIWQPPSNTTRNTSNAITNNSQWQLNRDNAFNEAFRSVGNIPMGTSLGPTNPTELSQYSINSDVYSGSTNQSYNALQNNSINIGTQQPYNTLSYNSQYLPAPSSVSDIVYSQSMLSQYSDVLPSISNTSYSLNGSQMQLNTTSLTESNTNIPYQFQSTGWSDPDQYNNISSYNGQFHTNETTIYKNPMDSIDGDSSEPSAETLVARMRDSAAKEKLQLNNSYKPPTVLSSASMARVTKDLKEAAAPFESAETLTKFRNMQLGINTKTPYKSSSLSVNAAEFVPRNKLSTAPKQQEMPAVNEEEIETTQEIAAINLTDAYIELLTCNPGCFADTVGEFVTELRNSNLSFSAISIIVDKIYEMCVMEANFRYLGSLLCDRLSRSVSGLKKYRTTLLTKAQKEFNSIDDTFYQTFTSAQRVRDFTHFTGELFLNLLLESSRERLAVLGRGLIGILRKLVDHPDNNNIQCAVRVLKLTAGSLEETLATDGKGSIDKLNAILDDLQAINEKKKHVDLILDELSLNLLRGLVRFRQQNWGKDLSAPSQSEADLRLQNPDLLSLQDENYYMNEPVFFTASGKQYTAADAADPEFFKQHLVHQGDSCDPVALSYSNADDYQKSSYYVNYSNNPLNDDSSYNDVAPYAVWSSGDTDQYDPSCQEDDYEADFEAFLRSSGQIP